MPDSSSKNISKIYKYTKQRIEAMEISKLRKLLTSITNQSALQVYPFRH